MGWSPRFDRFLRPCLLALAASALVACGAVTDPSASDAGGGRDAGGEIDASDGCGGCAEGAECVGSGDEARCECREGYAGDGDLCTDIDECATGAAACVQNAECSNLEGSFRCDCAHGFVGDGAEVCRNGRLYFAGPSSEEGGVGRYFKSFDVATGAFEDEALMPVDTDDFCNCGFSYDGPISAEGSLYYFGNHAQRYRSSWTGVPQPVHARAGEYGAAYAGGRIYMVGGRRGSLVATNTVVSFDPISNQWSAPGDIAPLPWATSYAAVGASGGRLYVVGASVDAGGAPTMHMAVYDIATNEWRTVAPPPFTGIVLSGVTVGGVFYVHRRNGTQVHAYSIADEGWDLSKMIEKPAGALDWRLTAVNGELYGIGDEGGQVVIRRFDGNSWSVVGEHSDLELTYGGYVGSSNFD